jgi:nucleoside-diphosphate kinase
MQRTLVIIKPDAVNRESIGRIIDRFERKGLKIIAMKMEKLEQEKLKEHYKHLNQQNFFEDLLHFMSSIPAVLIVLEGIDATPVVRQMCGPTKGTEAPPGTIRGDYSMSNQANIVHASENKETAKQEIQRFFKKEELMKYEKITFETLYSKTEKQRKVEEE